jgi:hypothetical protein
MSAFSLRRLTDEMMDILADPRVSVFFLGRGADPNHLEAEHHADFVRILFSGPPEYAQQVEGSLLDHFGSDPRCVNHCLRISRDEHTKPMECVYLVAWFNSPNAASPLLA